ncbi:7-carboxy-7-deazaguanine synthase QueE [Leeia aquatica]|uniref:7-carboxy-7-deazaguanine synthase n=1 Tax=Leeia aquatica TaxID=2725557 RepID=A0A847SBV4_9NEIS|nr:7-carboxy-7-deazaguanine synthase QueE [Leeia aquatica]NLR74996.1 7-carboxy-7-deazaguanine synthase QueE [Leeia aquatica]
MARPDSVRLTEIFFSLQGESSRVGLPTVFIRLTGCPLRCGYCDSEYAFYGGETWHFDRILDEVAKHPTRTVCVTGGEPLAQRNCLPLLTALCDAGYSVSLETSGAMPIGEVDPRVSRIVDLKTPGSGEVDKNCWDNLPLLTAQDELKFVLTSEADYQWARQQVEQHQLAGRCPVLFSPVWQGVSPTDLAGWIVRDGLPVRMQVQLHKILWGEKPGV